MTKRVIIVDDHQLVLDGLVTMINSEPGFQLHGTASNGKELLNRLSEINSLPDIIVMDIDMPELNGIDTAKLVKKDYPSIKVLLLTMHNESVYYNKAVAAQADGFIKKNSNRHGFLQAIYNVCDGIKHFPFLPKSSSNSQPSANVDNLTAREIEILKKIAAGLSNKEISISLGISARTVDTHRTNLKKKLSASGIAELVRYAFQQGYLS
jgi:two-component system, NarL family, nitrate/nitrite response regulator NarL